MKRSFLFALLGGICLSVLSQERVFVNGYIISNDNKTDFLKIAINEESENYASCTIRQPNGQLQEFFPKDIKGFGLMGGEFFRSVKENNRFAKVIVNGSLSLWKDDERFYFADNISIYEFNVDTELDGVNEILMSCLTSENIERLLKNNESSLKKLVIYFNQCVNEEYILYEPVKEKKRLEVGLMGGVAQSKLKLEKSARHSYLGDHYKSNSAVFGISINISFPKSIEKCSFQTGIQTGNYSFQNLEKEENTQGDESYHETFINYSEISIPLSIRYAPLKFLKAKPYIQIGASYRKLNSNNTVLLTETIKDGVVTTEPSESAFQIENNSLGLIFSIGASQTFKSFQGDLFLEYLNFGNISTSEGVSSKNRVLSFGASIRYVLSFY